MKIKEYHIIIALVLLNIGLSSVIFCQASKVKRIVADCNRYKTDVLELQHQEELIWMYSLEMTPNLLQREFHNLGLIHQIKTSPALGLFLPVNVCGVCSTEQCEILKEYLDTFIEVIVVCPQFKLRDLRAYFMACDNVQIIGYDYEKVRSSLLQSLDRVVLFMINKESSEIIETVVTEKTHPEWSKRFFEKHINSSLWI